MGVKLISAMLFSFFFWHAGAQNKMSLKKCIEYGLSSNPSTIVYENEKRIADAKAKEVLADYLPYVDLIGSVDNNLRVQEQVIPAGLFGDEDIRIAFTKQFSTNATLQINQNIYDQTAIVGIKANKVQKKQALLNQKKNDENIIFNISTAYYQIYTYLEQLELLNTNIEAYAKQLEIVDLKVKKGVVIKKEFDQVQVDYNNLMSQKRIAQTNIELATNQLKYEMGYPMENPLEIEVIDTNETDANPWQEIEVQNLIDYQLDQINLEVLTFEQKRINAGYFPKLSAYGRLGMNGFGDKVTESLSSLKSFSSVGIKLSMPVFDGFKRNSQYRQSKLEYYNALEQNKLNEGKYKLNFENSKSKLYEAQSNLENDKRNMELAQSVFEVTDFNYQKGVTDMTDWLNSQRSLKESQNSYLSSFYSLLQANLKFISVFFG